jgi:hypothetical protein
MGEWFARLLSNPGYALAIDEPYQHFQFAGRADVLGWQIDPPALLHIENRTRFPNIQEAAGSYNAKRSYLPASVAQRLALRGGFDSVTHVMAVLWSAEAQHEIRVRTATFAAICPDPLEPLEAWLRGTPPASGVFSILALVDPLAIGRHRRFVSLDDTVRARPRYRGYAEAVDAFRAAGLC